MGNQYNRKPIEFQIDSNGCFICTSHSLIEENGYPRIKVDNKLVIMSRFIYEQCFGEIPEGMCVCHTCDNPQCINPKHLFLGTHTVNMRDMAKKGRGVSGKQKLLPEQYSKIRDLLAIGKLSYKKIGDLFGVSADLIYDYRKEWGFPCRLNS